MARSSVVDPIDKFRFRVSFFRVKVGGSGNFGSIYKSREIEGGEISAGFTEITMPTARTKEMLYRENVDAPKHIKVPGLTTYEPVTFRRGVTSNRELYKWYREIHNDSSSLGAVNEVLAAQGIIPVFPVDFRKDVRIDALNRDGTIAKAWFLLDAFPIAYRPGNDFSANSSEKLIQELTITYESLLEVPDDSIEALNQEALDAAQNAATAGVVSNVISFFG